MDVRVGDKLRMKKSHPCGSKDWLVLRIGADFRLRCFGCGHEVMVKRSKAEKNIKKIIKQNNHKIKNLKMSNLNLCIFLLII